MLKIVFLFLMTGGIPVAIAMAGASLLYILGSGNLPAFAVVHRMIGGIDSFPLLAVPFFILAGNLMNNAGITNRIYNFALALVGWLKGGLGHVNVVGSVIFAGMSGTAIADAAGLGTIEIKAMKDHGYSGEFAVGVTAASATLGPIIPPSLPFVIYAMMANVSVGALFLAGLLPGILMAFLMMVTVAWFAHKNKWGGDVKFSGSRFGKAIIELAVVAAWPTAAITILVPILLPIATQLGVDPVHFGLVMVLNLMIGLLHPPMGMVLFVLARVAGLSFERTTMAILPWLVPLLVSLVILTYVPAIVLWVPRMLM